VALARAAARPGSLRDVRAWWRGVHPPASLGSRLDVLYMAAISAAILGAMAYGTASTALAQVVTPATLAVYAPALALLVLVAVAHWGVYQGPVAFTVADVMYLLGAPLSRRALGVRSLAKALLGGVVAGALLAAVVLVGLGGGHHHVDPVRAVAFAAGLADLLLIGVAAAWAVQRSSTVERLLRRGTWVAGVAAVALVVAANAGGTARDVADWSGPWGWVVRAEGGAAPGAWAAALAAATALALLAAAAALRTCGTAPAERHLHRAEARAAALASLFSFDARGARQAIGTVGARPATRTGGVPRLWRLAARTGPTRRTTAVVAWRDAVSVSAVPGRAVEAVALSAAGTAVMVLNTTRFLALAAGGLIVYAGAARMLWPLRGELDVPARMTVLLRPRPGRVLLAHATVPAVATVAAAVLGVAGCAVAGALPGRGGSVALAAVAAAVPITLCAALSARRGGRLPQTLVMRAVGADPTGGGAAVIGWLLLWPGAAAVLATAAVLLGRTGPGGGLVALAGTTAAALGLAGRLGTDPA
jgi:hypothetical protein